MVSPRRVVLLIPLVVVVSGCKLPSIVGEWESTGLLGNGSTARYTFRADGTFSSSVQMSPPGMLIPIVAEAEGTYKITGDKITSSATSYTVNGIKVENLDSVNENVREEVKRPLKGVFQWVNPNEITIIQGRFGNTIILQRLKSNAREADKV